MAIYFAYYRKAYDYDDDNDYDYDALFYYWSWLGTCIWGLLKLLVIAEWSYGINYCRICSLCKFSFIIAIFIFLISDSIMLLILSTYMYMDVYWQMCY